MNYSILFPITGLVVMLATTPSFGGPPNPTQSDQNGNTAGGTNALVVVTVDGGINTAFGLGALASNTAGDANTACGAIALFNNTTGFQNTATGAFALESNTTGNSNTASGSNALQINTTGSFNTADGISALEGNTDGEANTATGAFALQDNTGGGFNTASGAFALQHNTGGSDNTASGVSALQDNTTGGFNTAGGASALFRNTTGFQNTASGALALGHNTTGIKNTAVGFDALGQSTGNQNIAVGHGAGAGLTSGNRNIYLGHPGGASESKVMRLGNGQTKTFIAGVAATGVSGTTVRITPSGQLGIQVSSARYKRNIEPMAGASDGLLKLRPVTFVYVDDAKAARQFGLIAEEVATIYPDLVNSTEEGEIQGVRYEELIPMLLNELQRQHRELAELRSQLGQLRGALTAAASAEGTPSVSPAAE